MKRYLFWANDKDDTFDSQCSVAVCADCLEASSRLVATSNAYQEPRCEFCGVENGRPAQYGGPKTTVKGV